MKTKELRREEWAGFCQKLTTENAGALVTVCQVTREGREESLVESAPLERVEFAEQKDRCSDVLRIKAGALDHSVVEPIYIRLKEGSQDRFNRVEIQAESGGIIMRLNRGVLGTV